MKYSYDSTVYEIVSDRYNHLLNLNDVHSTDFDFMMDSMLTEIAMCNGMPCDAPPFDGMTDIEVTLKDAEEIDEMYKKCRTNKNIANKLARHIIEIRPDMKSVVYQTLFRDDYNFIDDDVVDALRDFIDRDIMAKVDKQLDAMSLS